MNCGSVDSFQVSTRCGLRPNARQIRRPPSLMHAYIVLSLTTGLRTEEIRALHWGSCGPEGQSRDRPANATGSHATGLDRNELGALLVAAGLGSPGEHALISLLALNGLRGLRSHWRQH